MSHDSTRTSVNTRLGK